MVVALILAILNAVQGRGRDRAYWVGFAISGWIYLVLVFWAMGYPQVTSPPLLTGQLYDHLEPLFHPAAPAAALAPAQPVEASPFQIAAGPNTVPNGPPDPFTYYAINLPREQTSVINFAQVAHSLTALLVGMLGGLYSLWLVRRREHREANPVAEVIPSSP